MQYEQFFALRLAQLRSQKKVSAREMSLPVSRRMDVAIFETSPAKSSSRWLTLKPMPANISPAEFFDPSNKEPEHLDATYAALKKLSPARLALVSQLIDELSKAK